MFCIHQGILSFAAGSAFGSGSLLKLQHPHAHACLIAGLNQHPELSLPIRTGRKRRRNPELSRQLLEEQRSKEAGDPAYQAMQRQRATLPAAAHRQQVLEAIAGTQVGSTGYQGRDQ
jgi:HrpA-like RNA helicase